MPLVQAMLGHAAALYAGQPRVLASLLALLEALWRESSSFGRYGTVVAALRAAGCVGLKGFQAWGLCPSVPAHVLPMPYPCFSSSPLLLRLCFFMRVHVCIVGRAGCECLSLSLCEFVDIDPCPVAGGSGRASPSA